MSELIRLNLGSGYLPLPGYKNVDLIPDGTNFGVDVVHDITKMKELYQDNTVDEIFAKDVLEHVGWRVMLNVLKDWIDILKPGGVLKIRLPDTDKIMEHYINNRNREPERTLFGRTIHLLFGDQNFTENSHLGGCKQSILVEDLKNMGMRIPIPPWYDGGRDLRISAVKGTEEPLVSLEHEDYQYKTYSHQGWRDYYLSLKK